MTHPGDVAAALDGMVRRGDLVGYVAGVRDRGRAQVVAGGRRSVGGEVLTPDAVFPLSSSSKPVAGVLALALIGCGAISLDDPVAGYLPELAEPRVLARPGGPCEETVPAERPITLRHLLTMTAGFGWAGEAGPLPEAMLAQQVAPGPFAPPMPPDEYLRRLGALPLIDHPGRGWYYHTCSDVLGVLLARATGTSVAALLSRHVTGPLGLRDLGLTAGPGRMPTGYGVGPGGGLRDLGIADRFGRVPEFESLACGLASTVADYLALLEVLVDGDPLPGRALVEEMATDHLTAGQRATAEGFLDPGSGYGFQVEVRAGGAVGWAGGLGTIGYVDRRSGRSAAVFTTQSYDVPGTTGALELVWSLLA